MTAETPSLDADLEGPISPPRDNGEIVFAAPWERRVFGLAVAACRSGACDWEAFRKRLICRIADDDQRPYWQSWAAALEDVLEDTAVLARGELDEHHHQLLSRPAGFDHHAQARPDDHVSVPAGPAVVAARLHSVAADTHRAPPGRPGA